jgi:hypothetical protein
MQKIGKFYGSEHPDDGPREIDAIIEKLLINPLTYILSEKFGMIDICNDFEKMSTTLSLYVQGQRSAPLVKISYGKELIVELSDNLAQGYRHFIGDYISLVKGTLNDILNYHNSRALFDSYPNSARKDFYLVIFEVLNKYIDNFQSIEMGKLEELLSSQIIPDLTAARRNSPLRLSTIESIRHNILKLTTKQVKNVIGRTLTEVQLLALKGEMSKKIDNHILSYKIGSQGDTIKTYRYFPSHNYRDRKLMVEFSTSLIMATTLKTGEKMTFEKFRGEIFNTKLFDIIKAKGFPQGGTTHEKFFVKPLERVYNVVFNWFQEDLGTRDSKSKDSFLNRFDPLDQSQQMKFIYYSRVLRSVADICEAKGYDIASPSIQAKSLVESLDAKEELIMNHYDKDNWDETNSKIAHRVFHLSKYIGFDPLFFSDIDSDMSKSRRHHFNAVIFRKISSYIRDCALTDVKYHQTYEILFEKYGSQVMEALIRGLLNSIEDLIYFKDNNGEFKQNVDEDDVITILKKNLGSLWKIGYEYWKNGDTEEGRKNKKIGGKFDLDLAEFNRRPATYIFDFASNRINKNWEVSFLQGEFSRFYQKNIKVIHKVPSISKFFVSQDDTEYLNNLFRRIVKINLETDGLDSFL